VLVLIADNEVRWRREGDGKVGEGKRNIRFAARASWCAS
jgi:hypothetical protein